MAKTALSGPRGGADLMPLDFMLALLRDEFAALEDRKWAAYHAAPYCHPRRTAVDGSGEGPLSHEEALELLK